MRAQRHDREYMELRRVVEEAGLFKRQPLYYCFKLASTFALFGLSVAILIKYPNNAVTQLANAGLLAFVFTQLAFLGHDLGHNQAFRSRLANILWGWFVGNLVVGVSFRAWVRKHNKHHCHPNHLGSDPDIYFPIIAFCPEQAAAANAFARWFIRRQAFLFLPLLALAGVSIRFESVVSLCRSKSDYRIIEWPLLIAHCVVYFGGLFVVLGVYGGTVFCLVHEILFGVYLGASFATNHNGMPIFAETTNVDFVRQQIVTSRNLRRNRLSEFMFGSLGSQIEHHLFPTMPRNQLRHARRFVRAFCHERSLPYYETGVIQAFGEVLRHLRAVGRSLETNRRP